MQQAQIQSMLPEADLAYTVLADLKRVVREYATAATEANCPEIRQMFTDLLNSSLRMQGDLYQLMQQNNMYSSPSPALRQELEKQLDQNRQTLQQTKQLIQQMMSAAPQAMQHMPMGSMQSGQTHPQQHQQNQQHQQQGHFYN
ncbi:spore coat protein [Paenibacillus sp. IB182496]|uniref:Spore coat protein n=1 Tax=Paenibacillus sabuli TaxID=2772509 RepID=A0A927BX16_9BACL|nr:spore coat protein [Paenibacillus sabuli]MBD2848442.1 spore coat protein [Paenibacillus sabuli]